MHYRQERMGNLKPSSKKKEKSYITKVLKQLTGVLIILLILMLFRFTNTNIGNTINTTLKESFYSDYTNEINEAFNKYTPEVKDAVETFVKGVEKQ